MGVGIDSEKLKAKILERGLASEDELDRMSRRADPEIYFHAGFSLAKEVTGCFWSRRWHGCCTHQYEQIGGTVDMTSVVGKGTSFIIKIPADDWRLFPRLLLKSCGQRFAIPQLSVIELVRTHGEAGHTIEMINDTPVLRLRNKLLPLIYLNKQLSLEPSEQDREQAGKEFVIVTQVGSQIFGVVVDSVLSIRKRSSSRPMSNMLREITMFSGNTILGDGSVIMIIDPNGIAQNVAADSGAQAAVAGQQENIANDQPDLTTLLVFSAGVVSSKLCRFRLSQGWKKLMLQRSSAPMVVISCSIEVS